MGEVEVWHFLRYSLKENDQITLTELPFDASVNRLWPGIHTEHLHSFKNNLFVAIKSPVNHKHSRYEVVQFMMCK